MTKDPGHIVLTKTGKKGRTFTSKGHVRGKIPVYLEANQDLVFGDQAILCDPKSLIIKGYID